MAVKEQCNFFYSPHLMRVIHLFLITFMKDLNASVCKKKEIERGTIHSYEKSFCELNTVCAEFISHINYIY